MCKGTPEVDKHPVLQENWTSKANMGIIDSRRRHIKVIGGLSQQLGFIKGVQVETPLQCTG